MLIYSLVPSTLPELSPILAIYLVTKVCLHSFYTICLSSLGDLQSRFVSIATFLYSCVRNFRIFSWICNEKCRSCSSLSLGFTSSLLISQVVPSPSLTLERFFLSSLLSWEIFSYSFPQLRKVLDYIILNTIFQIQFIFHYKTVLLYKALRVSLWHIITTCQV